MSDAERIACCDDDVRDDFADDRSNEYANDNAIAEEHVHDLASLMPLSEYLTRYPNADRRLLCKQLAAQLSVYHNAQHLVHGDVKMTSPEERLPMTTATDLYAFKFAWLVFQASPYRLPFIPHTHAFSGIKPNRPGPDTLPTMRGLNDQIWGIMLKCWHISPAARPRAGDVLEAFNPVHVASQPQLYGAEIGSAAVVVTDKQCAVTQA
ncbi:hypothetical protein EXIGLDRAFT_835609 [Exidia glandulosa HHB12029]|uniref:Protein kinase domain-containing protein n=1 Tax=Exidia glandulosa HHB12029 TaxID=1314781 RepID=A0A165IKR3_EXIGL|nr:hypothetical protein EXIGLDRAFT_835609 [Exidia glandulosa HHB12029]